MKTQMQTFCPYCRKKVKLIQKMGGLICEKCRRILKRI